MIKRNKKKDRIWDIEYNARGSQGEGWICNHTGAPCWAGNRPHPCRYCLDHPANAHNRRYGKGELSPTDREAGLADEN